MTSRLSRVVPAIAVGLSLLTGTASPAAAAIDRSRLSIRVGSIEPVGTDPVMVAAKLARCKEEGWTDYQRALNTWDRHTLVRYTGCYFTGSGKTRNIVYYVSVWGPNDGQSTNAHLRGNH